MTVERLSVSALTLLLFCGLQMTSASASEGGPDTSLLPFQVAQATPTEEQKAREKKPEPRPAPQQQQRQQPPPPPPQQQRQAPPPRQAPPAAERREPQQQQRREAPPERRQVQPERRPEAPPRREVQPERKVLPVPPPIEKRVTPTPEKREAAPPERRANPIPQVPALKPPPSTLPPAQQSAPVQPKSLEPNAPTALEQRPGDRRAAPVTPTTPNATPPNVVTPPAGGSAPVLGSPGVPPGNTGAAKSATPPPGVPPAQPPTTTAQPLKPGAPPIAGAAVGVAAGVAGAAAIGALAPPVPKAPEATAPPQKFEDVQKSRQQRVEDGGRRTVIQEGNRIIIKQDNRIIIQHDEGERFRRVKDSQTQRRPDGIVETFYVRPDGFRVVSEVDGSGRLLRRFRRGPDGREFGIIDNRRFYRNAAIGVGLGAIAIAIALNVTAPRIVIPRERYIVDYDRASDDDLYEALTAPPVERLERSYSLEEVRYSYELREHMRRVDLNDVTFAFGAYEIGPDQFGKLERLARSILRALRENPEEVFLVEGHTDAVGADVDNLSLSDRRASAVAQVLSETFGVPPENLVTQGYGEQYLKVKTQDAERANRRVAVRRITPLMAEK